MRHAVAGGAGYSCSACRRRRRRPASSARDPPRANAGVPVTTGRCSRVPTATGAPTARPAATRALPRLVACPASPPGPPPRRRPRRPAAPVFLPCPPGIDASRRPGRRRRQRALMAIPEVISAGRLVPLRTRARRPGRRGGDRRARGHQAARALGALFALRTVLDVGDQLTVAARTGRPHLDLPRRRQADDHQATTARRTSCSPATALPRLVLITCGGPFVPELCAATGTTWWSSRRPWRLAHHDRLGAQLGRPRSTVCRAPGLGWATARWVDAARAEHARGWRCRRRRADTPPTVRALRRRGRPALRRRRRTGARLGLRALGRAGARHRRPGLRLRDRRRGRHPAGLRLRLDRPGRLPPRRRPAARLAGRHHAGTGSPTPSPGATRQRGSPRPRRRTPRPRRRRHRLRPAVDRPRGAARRAGADRRAATGHHGAGVLPRPDPRADRRPHRVCRWAPSRATSAGRWSGCGPVWRWTVQHSDPDVLALVALGEPAPAADAEHLGMRAVPRGGRPAPARRPPPVRAGRPPQVPRSLPRRGSGQAIAARTGVAAAPRPDRVSAAGGRDAGPPARSLCPTSRAVRRPSGRRRRRGR